MAEEKKKTPEIMQPADFVALTQQVLEAREDQGKLSLLLTQLQDGYAGLFATHTSASEQYKKVSEENDKLKQYNFELMVQHGTSIVGTGTGIDTGTGTGGYKTKEEERAATITTDMLFKEMNERKE